MTIGELFIVLGFKADTIKLKEFMRAVGELNMSSIMTSIGLGTLYEATNKIIGVATTAGMSMYNFSQQTGLSAQEMTQFAEIVEESGGNAKEAEQFIRKIQQDLVLMSMGMPSSLQAMWRFLNINPYQLKSISDAADKIQLSFAKMSQSQRVAAVSLGVPLGIQNALQMHQKLYSLMTERPIPNKEQINNIQKFYSEWQKIIHFFNTGLTQMWGTVSPIFTKMLYWLETLLKGTWQLQAAFVAIAAVMIGKTAMTAIELIVSKLNIAILLTTRLSILFGVISNAVLVIGVALASWKIVRMISEKTGLDEFLGGKEGILTKMFIGLDKLTGRYSQPSQPSTVHIHVSGTGNPEEVARRTVEEINKKDRNNRYYGDNEGWNF